MSRSATPGSEAAALVEVGGRRRVPFVVPSEQTADRRAVCRAPVARQAAQERRLVHCEGGEKDRAVYLLTDPEFLTRFSQRLVLDSLPADVSSDVYAALERADRARPPCYRGLMPTVPGDAGLFRC